MLEFEEALARVLAAVPAPTSETIPLSDAAGRRAGRAQSGRPLTCRSSITPRWMAMRCGPRTWLPPGRTSPVRLRLAGKVAAGAAFAGEVTAGTCVRLFTGAPLPPGADAVVMQEDTRLDPNARRRGPDPGPGRAGGKCAGPRRGRGARLDAGRSRRSANGRPDRSAGCGRFGARWRGPAAGGGFTGHRFGTARAGPTAGAGPDLREQPAALVVLLRRAGAVPRTFPLVADDLAATQPGPGGGLQPMRCGRDFRRRFGRGTGLP